MCNQLRLTLLLCLSLALGAGPAWADTSATRPVVQAAASGAGADALRDKLAKIGAALVRPKQVLAADVLESKGLVSPSRLGINSKELRARALAVIRSSGKSALKFSGNQAVGALAFSGSAVLHDLLQVAIIMGAAMVAQVVKDSTESDRLLNGQKLDFAEVKAKTTQAAENLLCGGEHTNIGKEIACNGEFWLGVGGGVFTKAAISYGVVPILTLLARANPTRAALINILGSFGASFFMLAGFSMGSNLWKQAVHLLNDPAKEEQAHGLFGRAAQEKLSGNWEKYVQTDDGKLAQQVFENMTNILIVKPELRDTWLNNAWRFGVARGEILTSLAAIAGAMTVANPVGGKPAALLSFKEKAIAFLVTTVVGAGVAAAMTYAPDLHIGETITSAIQEARSMLAGYGHTEARSGVFGYAEVFSVKSEDGGRLDLRRNREFYTNRFVESLDRMPIDRGKWASIAIEKFQEISNRVDELKHTISVANEIIHRSELQKFPVFNSNGEVMSSDEVRQKLCPRAGTTTAAAPSSTEVNCVIPMDYQISKVTEARAAIATGEAAMNDIANAVINAYHEDALLLYNLVHERNDLHRPSEIATKLTNEIDDTIMKLEILKVKFASILPAVREAWNVEFDNAEQLNAVKIGTMVSLQQMYINGLVESELLERQKMAATSP